MFILIAVTCNDLMCCKNESSFVPEANFVPLLKQFIKTDYVCLIISDVLGNRLLQRTASILPPPSPQGPTFPVDWTDATRL